MPRIVPLALGPGTSAIPGSTVNAAVESTNMLVSVS
jgi:hypothetical protein